MHAKPFDEEIERSVAPASSASITPQRHVNATIGDVENQIVVALDVDGVLIDPVGRHPEGWLAIVGPRFGVTRDDMRGFFQPDRFGRVVLGHETVEAALTDYFAAIGRDVDAEAFLDDWLANDLCVNEEVASAAETWARAGVPIVLATTQEHRRADRLRKLFGDRLGLTDLIYSALLGVEKPAPEYFRIADERVGHRDVVFIDDALRNVEAARAHGWTAIHYPQQADWRSIVEGSIEQRAKRYDVGRRRKGEVSDDAAQ